MFLLLGVAMAMVLPWSIYASTSAHTLILFSTESQNLGLFDAHNEYTAIDGQWHPEWETDPKSIYNRDGMEAYSDSVRIAHFYVEDPTRIIRLPLSKMIAAFTTVPSIVLLVLFLMCEGLLGSLLQRKSLRLIAFIACIALWWALTAHNTLYGTLMPLVNTPSMWAIALSTLIIIALLVRRFFLPFFPRLPLMATAVILNFVFLMILVMSDSAIYMSRHVKVMEFLSILLAASVVVEWVCALMRPSLHTHD
jgi:hypothetical protein